MTVRDWRRCETCEWWGNPQRKNYANKDFYYCHHQLNKYDKTPGIHWCSGWVKAETEDEKKIKSIVLKTTVEVVEACKRMSSCKQCPFGGQNVDCLLENVGEVVPEMWDIDAIRRALE
jgi:hypothetical protein